MSRSRSRLFGVAATAVIAVGLIPAAVVSSPAASAATTACPWLDATKTPAARANMLLSAMSLADKIQMVHGVGAVENQPVEVANLNLGDAKAGPGSRGVGYVAENTGLCIPALYNSDGGQGYATSNTLSATGATAFPSGIVQASTFDTTTAKTYGTELGRQFVAKGANVILGPDLNDGRGPGFSRNFEGDGGEDPYLQGMMAASTVTGIQSQPIIAMVKHYAAYDAGSQNAVVDERTLQELYEKPFANVVKAGVGSVMCAYEKVNGQYSCESPDMINTLKTQMGFTGYLSSDYGADHSTVTAANAGLDQEMAAGSYFDAALTTAVQAGQVPMSRLNDMVYRIIYTMFRLGLFDHTPGAVQSTVATAYDDTLGRQISQEGTVMLKNTSNALPLTLTNSTIAVIGAPASVAGAELFDQSPSSPDSKVVPSNLSDPLSAITTRAQQNGDTVVYDPGAAPQASAAVAAAAKVAVVFVYTTEGELAMDRTTFTLPANQDALVSAVAAANPNTIVVVNSGGPISMPWISNVSGVLEAWYPGEQDGNSIAGILFGDAEPGGRLPETFPISYADEPPLTDTYSEGLYTGYRWFDKTNKAVLFPFGYGLTYTTFGYSNLKVPATTSGSTPVSISLTVKNTGTRSGSDLPQIYVGWPKNASVVEPVRQLRGFTRVALTAGKGQTLTIPLDSRSFSYYNTTTSKWTVQAGCYPVYASHNERDTTLTGHILVGGASASSCSKAVSS